MLEGAERTAQLFDVTREELDPWAVRSHARAAAARPVVAPFIAPYSVFVKMKASGLTFPKTGTPHADTLYGRRNEEPSGGCGTDSENRPDLDRGNELPHS